MALAGHIAPVTQLAREARLPWTDALSALDERSQVESARLAPYYVSIIADLHPDHDTAEWPATGAGKKP